MKIDSLSIEYQKSPIGLDTKKPRFTWTMKSDFRDVLQVAYHIIITKSEEVIWDTGRVDSQQSVLIDYDGAELEPCTQYKVRIFVWDNKDCKDSIVSQFETGLLSGTNFTADWISNDFPKEISACPIFLKEFSVNKCVKNVRIYATALGVYEIKINSNKVGDSYFAPGWTNYKERLQYQTYVADDLIEDYNKIEITVGNGWYKGALGHKHTPNIYGDKAAVLAEIHINYTDGTKEIIITDSSWKVRTGVIRSSEIYMGEYIDTCFTEEKLREVIEYSYDKKLIVGQECEEVKVQEKISAKDYFETSKGEKVIDFGQNISGIVEVKIKGEVGQKIAIRHAETLDKDGNFYTENLRGAKAVDTYICNGENQTFLPHFTYHGFRYISVEGIDEIELQNFKALALYSAMDKTGEFKCSNELVNKLQNNIVWSQKGNFLDIPTDCPQRDERLGWTCDAQVFAGTATYNMNVISFFRKWLRDLASEQIKERGVPHVIPDILGRKDGAAVWSDAATFIPWTLYQTYGDVRVLEEQYDSMRDWVDYVISRCGDNGLWQKDYQYGDWLALDRGDLEDTGATDVYLVANAFFAQSTDILKKTAKILNKKSDYEKYTAQYDKIKVAFNKEYVTKSEAKSNHTQTAYILFLGFDLVDEEDRLEIKKLLEDNLKSTDEHLTTGFAGTPYLCSTLSKIGLHELAGRIFLKEDYPSWLYAVNKGATTVWERWDSIMPNDDFNPSGMNSLNHYAFGSIGEWMYKRLAGIDKIDIGFKKILIKPEFIEGISTVEAKFKSMYGDIKTRCNTDGDFIKLNVEIPVNTSAVIYLPMKDEVVEVGSGTYEFEYKII